MFMNLGFGSWHISDDARTRSTVTGPVRDQEQYIPGALMTRTGQDNRDSYRYILYSHPTPTSPPQLPG